MRVNKMIKCRHRKRSVGARIVAIFLIVYAVALMFPYVLALISSFRKWGDFTDAFFGVSAPTFENFMRVFREFNYPVVMSDGTPGAFYFDGLLFNSFAYAAGSALAATVAPCIVGYCTAKYPYKFSKFIIALVYVLIALPIVGTMPSQIQLARTLGLYDSIPGMWLLKFGFPGVNCLIFNATFSSIPQDYEEAAYMDGGGELSIFTRIMLPLGSNTFFIVYILAFVAFWSEYTTPLYFLPSHPTLALSLLNFSTLLGTTETMQFAACILLCIPSLVLYACFSEKITTNLQVGGIKG